MVKQSQLPQETAPTTTDYLTGVDAETTTAKTFTIARLITLIFNATSSLITSLNLGTEVSKGWLNHYNGTQVPAPNSVTYNGQRSYNLVFSGVDLTSYLQPGTRLRTTRTVAAPTQSTSLNGTNQYFNDTTVSGMTFTDDFVVGAWVKLSAYGGANAMRVVSRYNGTSGWALFIGGDGTVGLYGRNGGGGNISQVQSYQSIPLNKWVHITAQLDMSAFTATTTTSYVMIDGVDVPATVSRAGTNPTSLIQAGNLEIGSENGGILPFNGKIAQAFVSSAKITQANVRTLISQGLTSALVTSNNIVSAYSLSNSLTDINTTNANNLTAQNSATATNADSPFGTQGNGTISSTLDYGIIQSVSFSTDTTVVVQVPEGCTIPTSGGVSASAYSGLKAPYGFPAANDKWIVESRYRTSLSQAAAAIGTWYNIGSARITAPIGAWSATYNFSLEYSSGSTGDAAIAAALSTSSSGASETLARSAQIRGSTVFILGGQASRDLEYNLSSPTIYYLNMVMAAGAGTPTLSYKCDGSEGVIRFTNAYL